MLEIILLYEDREYTRAVDTSMFYINNKWRQTSTLTDVRKGKRMPENILTFSNLDIFRLRTIKL